MTRDPSAGPPGSPDDDEASPPDEPPRLRRLLVAMAALVLALGAIFGRHGLLEMRQFRLERDRLQADIARMEEAQLALEREVQALRTDPLATERIAREDLGLVRPGEKLILLPRTDVAERTAPGGTSGLDEIPSRP